MFISVNDALTILSFLYDSRFTHYYKTQKSTHSQVQAASII